jgi:DNA-binding LacI/PurR family transcriptional regulator
MVAEEGPAAIGQPHGSAGIAEIAARVGVSKSTVSYALSGKKPVSARTRARIQAVIQELGYQPSATARALARGQTHVLGLVIPRAGGRLSASHLAFVGALADAAGRAERDILLCPTTSTGELHELRRLTEKGRVDGVLLMETSVRDERVEYLRRRRFPFVSLGHTDEPTDHDWVDVDFEACVGACVRHLAELGHRRIALVNRPSGLLERGYGPARRALAGFRSAVADLGLPGRACGCDDSPEAGYDLARTLLQIEERPTAFVAVNEAALPGVLAAVADARLRIPRDVSVAGVLVAGAATSTVPTLTAADIPVEAMSDLAVEALLARLARPETPYLTRLIAPEVTARRSTGRVPGRP